MFAWLDKVDDFVSEENGVGVALYFNVAAHHLLHVAQQTLFFQYLCILLTLAMAQVVEPWETAILQVGLSWVNVQFITTNHVSPRESSSFLLLVLHRYLYTISSFFCQKFKFY